MSKIIARTIADLISELSTEQEIRHTILTCVQVAEAAGYRPGSEDLFRDICEHLQELADHEPDQGKRDRLLLAVEIVCRVAEES